MNKMLKHRLTELNLDVDDLLEVIDPPKNSNVFVYISAMEGLGTWESDFDVYVLCEALPAMLNKPGMDEFNRGSHMQRMCSIDQNALGIKNKMSYLTIDIEFWPYEQIDKMLTSVLSNKTANISHIKMLQRIKVGQEIFNSRSHPIVSRIMNSDFSTCSVNTLALFGDADLHDAVTLYNSGEYYGAHLSVCSATNKIVAAVNANNGHINLNAEKWSAKIFIQNNGFGDADLLERYLTFQFFNRLSKESIKEVCRERIVFVQDIISKVLHKQGRPHWINQENYDIMDYKKSEYVIAKGKSANLLQKF